MKILTNTLKKLSLSADIVDTADFSAKMSGVDAAIAGLQAQTQSYIAETRRNVNDLSAATKEVRISLGKLVNDIEVTNLSVGAVRDYADCISGRVSSVSARTEFAHERIDGLSAALSGTAADVTVLSTGLSSVVQDVSVVSGMIDTGLSTRVYNLENILSDCQELTPEDDVSSLLEVVNKLILRLGGKNVPDMLMQTFEGIRYVLKTQAVKKPAFMVDTWTGEVSAYGDVVS